MTGKLRQGFKNIHSVNSSFLGEINIHFEKNSVFNKINANESQINKIMFLYFFHYTFILKGVL